MIWTACGMLREKLGAQKRSKQGREAAQEEAGGERRSEEDSSVSPSEEIGSVLKKHAKKNEDMPVNVEFNLKKKAIPATPATQLVEVLVKACEEFKQDPSSHCLRHKKKCVLSGELDLALPLRLANLPNGASLDLQPLTEQEQKARVVSVTLQLEDGKRYQKECHCSTLLFDVLQNLEDVCGARLVTGVNMLQELPCVTVMNKTLEGEQLRSSSLLSIGLVSGGALLKYRLKKNEAAAGGEQKPEQPDAAQQNPSQPDEKMDDVASSAVPEPAEVPGGQAASEEQGGAAVKQPSEDLHSLEASKKAKEQKSGFKTRKMREEEREQKLSAYQTVVIRVVFPDRTWLQGKFSSQETFSDIYNFVRQALVQKERAFYLFMTPPPKRIEDSSSTQLKYSQLLPAARILFAWNESKSEPDCSYLSFSYMSRIEEFEEQSKKARMDVEGGGEAEAGASAEMDAEASKGEASGGDQQAPEPPRVEDDQRAAALRAAEKRAERVSGKPKWFKMR
ncbi:hypothetical protein GUITHDRAFT_102851 [Guillardia theta CCMP2712]|uniref:UBX domain-containing protein n=1 Tax=Guillardia theta (strain CCMP2712) TaxID=905079 RepID=L1JTQ7_GUITC|nr:hypothetical protein GUITHDRAFT_102851 [Guillardia theta CCMP2712]EKX51590.1 hypothetical protein GUITHDRAFT_102851 [Guillardia theta CCMP2712]|eukprot:XP_005838570.1 hypothetical protein GUITHDRAFT_102851 [Guillardia theta CCMP2712]